MGLTKPSFLCIGAPKSGTTSLYDILKQHPDIFLPNFKEPHFFDNDENYGHGLSWYLQSYFTESNERQLLGEFTPTYLSNFKAHQRIASDLNSDLKLIVLLRDPVDRAYSHYLHTKRDELEHFTFQEALAKESERLIKSDLSDIEKMRFSYLKQSDYFNQFTHLFKYFKKEQVRVFVFETDFISNRKKMIANLLMFLEVKPLTLNVNIKSNPASVARSKTLKKFMKSDSFLRRIAKNIVPSLELRQKIRNKIHASNNKTKAPQKLTKELRLSIFNQYFKEDVNRLEALLKKDLKIWKDNV